MEFQGFWKDGPNYDTGTVSKTVECEINLVSTETPRRHVILLFSR